MNSIRQSPEKNDFVIKVGTLIDGSGAPARLNVFLFVVDGKIMSICGVRPRILTDADLIDLSSCTLLPLLVDSHVHLFMDAESRDDSRGRQLRAGYDQIKPLIRRNIDRLLQHGVAAVRDGGDPGGFAARFKNESALGNAEGLCLKTSGRAWYKPGRYGAVVGGTPLAGRKLFKAIADEIDFVDQIKLIHSGLNSLSEFGRQTEPQFEPGELAAIVSLARKKKRRVMVHANGETPVRQAVEAGVNSIEHGFFMGRENLERMAEKEVFWVPTAVTMRAFCDLGREGGAVAARNLEHQISQMARAREAGVRIALGTDAGCPGVSHGLSIKKELSLLITAGYSVEQAIQCGTTNGAALLGLSAGLLAPGRPADFLVVAGGRDALPKSLAEATVFRSGQPLNPPT